MDRSLLVRFGPFTFDRTRLALQRDGRAVPIGGRGASILATLANADGEVVSRTELLDAVWPSQVVEERNLTVQVALLRRAMGNPPEDLDPIRTVSGVGYRLTCEAPRATIAELSPSLVVLPFFNQSGDPSFAFFADGVTEDIIAALSRFHTFAVLARCSSFSGPLRGASPAEAVAALRVRYVLDGSLRREGHRLRVAVRLTDDAGAVLWADRFEEELDGIFDVQDRITATVVGLVEPRITQAELERSRRKPPQSVDAYDHFLRGTARINRPDSSAAVYDAMVHHLDCAVALDPSFPQALACAGWAHEMRRTYGAASTDGPDDFALALDLCSQAETQAGDDALVLAIVALERHNLRDEGEASLALAERALELNPYSYSVLDLVGTVHMQRSLPDHAIELFRRCLRLAPASPGDAVSYDAIAACHLDAGRYAEAIEWEQRALGRRANWDTALITLIVAQALDGQEKQAREGLDRLLAVRPGLTIRTLMSRLPVGTRKAVERLWSEGLRRAGLPEQ